jgi:hypothetical protein
VFGILTGLQELSTLEPILANVFYSRDPGSLPLLSAVLLGIVDSIMMVGAGTCMLLCVFFVEDNDSIRFSAKLRKWGQEVHESWRHFRPQNMPSELRFLHDSEATLDQISVPVSASGAFVLAISKSVESGEDIKHYLTNRLMDISCDRNLPDWPSEDDINGLAKMSCGLFMYASTSLKFIDNDDDDPKDCMEAILRNGRSVRYPDLDLLYMEILKQQKDQKFLTGLLASLVLFSQFPLFVGFDEKHQTVPLTAAMLNLKDRVISAKLRGMHSLLKVSRTSIGVHHISFLKFLNRKSHCYHMSCRRANWIFLKLFASRTIRFYRWPFWYAVIFHFGPYSNI